MFIVMTSAGKVSKFGRYRNVAVVELEDGFEGVPKMISERAKGVKKIHHHYGPCNLGKTDRCEYHQKLKAAQEWAEDLNRLRAGED